MGASNAIGTGAVVLTANADQLVDGLDKAQKKTEKWAKDTGDKAQRAAFDAMKKAGHYGKGAEFMKDVDYAATAKLHGVGGGVGGGGKGGKEGGKGGGLFGALTLGGGAIGAGGALGVGLAAAGAMFHTAVSSAEALVDKMSHIGEIAKGYSNVGADRMKGVDSTQKSFDRIQGAFDNFYLTAADKLSPLFDKIASAFEVVGFVGTEVFSLIVDTIGEVITEVGKWIDDTFDLATTTTSAGDQVFAVLRFIGKGFAYAWDVAKAGAGGVVYAVAEVAKVLYDLQQSLIDLAKKLPDSLKPAGFDDFIAGMEKGTAMGRKWADDASKWGVGLIKGFGNSSAVVDVFFDKVQEKFNSTDRLAKAFGQILSGAFTAGSSEAYSVIAKFNAGNIVTGQSPANDPVQIAKQQLGENKKQNQKLQRIVGVLDRGTVVKIADE